MSETNEAQVANEAAPAARETMGMGEAANLLGLSVPQVRKLCKAYEQGTPGGLAFAWTSSYVQRVDINGHRLKGHRRPYADAVRELAAAKRDAESNPAL